MRSFPLRRPRVQQEINAKTNSRPLTLVNLPWTQDALMKKLQRGKVALENVVKTERGMIGVAAVKNIAYNKEVLVHYSFDGWTTVKETIAAFYKQDSSHQNDYFVFVLTNKDYYSGKGWKLEFAICYRVAGLEYWDNNNGKNYSLQS